MIYLYGAGGHAKVIADILEIRGIIPAGVFDDDLSKKIWNFPTLTFPGPFNFSADKLIISIGNNQTRKKIAAGKIVKYQTAIHPATVLSVHSSIGEGSVIMGGALINADTF